MKKIKALSTIMPLVILSVFLISNFVLAKTNSQVGVNLEHYAIDKNVNIMLYDDKGKIINEYHSDGLKVDFIYDKTGTKIKEIKNSDNVRKVLTENADKTIDVDTYKGNTYIGKEKTINRSKMLKEKCLVASNSDTTNIRKAAQGQASFNFVGAKNLMAKKVQVGTMSLTQYEDYIVNGRNMNSLAPSIWSVPLGSDKFGRPRTAMTQTDIQNFFNSKNSILKNQIEVWAKDPYGNVAYTGRDVVPAYVISKASQDWLINPKVLIATMQKEQGLVTKAPGSIPYSSRAFYFCMGYGATDGGDMDFYTGFDTQVDGAAHLFLTLWNEAFIKGQSAFPVLMTNINYGLTKSYGSETYKNYIWVKNCGTYALYKYTPHTFDVNITPFPQYQSGNYLFTSIMNSFWNGNWD